MRAGIEIDEIVLIGLYSGDEGYIVVMRASRECMMRDSNVEG